MPAARHITSANGTVRVRLFESRSGKYVRYELRWTDHHGEGHRLKRSNKNEALKEGRRIADDLARGHQHSEMSLADLATFRLSIRHLIGTGKGIESVCADYAEARKAYKAEQPDQPFPSLADMARAYAIAQPKTPGSALTIQRAIDDVLLAKQQAGASARWHATLKSQLARFAADHPDQLQSVRAARIQEWFLTLRTTSEQGKALLGARSRNNHLAAVQLLFGAPALRHHPERQAVLDLQPCAEAPADNAIWKPAEFQKLLETATLPKPDRSHLVPVLVLGGFCKLRSSEIQRVTWDRVRLDDARLLLRAVDTKTKHWRVVPIPDCAVAWLRAWRPATECGQEIWPWGSNKFGKDLRSLAKACGLIWRKNGLRNSAVTYDQMLAPDLSRVAREAGNSPGVLQTEYLALSGITLDDAKAWFNIYPEPRTNVIVRMEQTK